VQQRCSEVIQCMNTPSRRRGAQSSAYPPFPTGKTELNVKGAYSSKSVQTQSRTSGMSSKCSRT
jgi:hypothetical protein